MSQLTKQIELIASVVHERGKITITITGQADQMSNDNIIRVLTEQYNQQVIGYIKGWVDCEKFYNFGEPSHLLADWYTDHTNQEKEKQ